MSYPRHEALVVDADILSFQKYVSTKTAISSCPTNTAGCLWSRFLQSIIPPETQQKRAPSTFAKFNDGFGESGVSLAEAVAGIRKFIRGEDSEGNGN